MLGGTSIAVQWLRCRISTVGDRDSIPCQGTKMAHTAQGALKKNFFLKCYVRKLWTEYSVLDLRWKNIYIFLNL